MNSRRAGASLLEVVVAMAAGALLTQLVLACLVAQRRTVEGLTRRSEALGAVRVGRHLLAADTRAWSDTLAGWEAGPDSLALRVVRGLAVACAEAGAAGDDGTVLVRVSGVRAPDAAKDSVLALTPDGRTRRAALVSSEPANGDGCPPGPGRPYRWRLDPADVEPVLARYFERGSYHLTGGALRYRRGLSGRQPLTPEVVAAASAFDDRGQVGMTVPPDTFPWRQRAGW